MENYITIKEIHKCNTNSEFYNTEFFALSNGYNVKLDIVFEQIESFSSILVLEDFVLVIAILCVVGEFIGDTMIKLV